MKRIITVLFILVLSFGVTAQAKRKTTTPRPKKELTQADIDALVKEADEILRKKDWEYIAESQKDIFYYRTIGIKNIDKDTVQFWLKTKAKAKPETLAQKLNLYQINCRTNQSRITHLTLYNKDGSVYLDDDTVDNFSIIKPDTYGEIFAEVICRDYWNR